MMYRMNKGFSLVEMLVAATIFSFMIVAITGIYSQIISLQRRAQGAARVQENALFIVESLAREIRFAKVSTPPDETCSTTLLSINHPVNGLVEYQFQGGAIFRKQELGTGGTGTFEQITSPEVEFISFGFCIDGTEAGDDEQVRITMPMTIQNIASHPGNRVKVSLQTTVVSRDLETDLTD